MEIDADTQKKRWGMRSGLLWGCLCLLLSGCAGSFQPPADSSLKFDPNNGTGIIVGSVTHALKSINPEYAALRIMGSSAKQLWEVRSGGQVISMGLSSNGKDFRDYESIEGTVFAIQLPAGNYRFLGWELHNGNVSIVPNGGGGALPFTVEPGKIIYVGNFFIDTVINNDNFLGANTVADGMPHWLDQKERDLPRIAKKYPNLPIAQVSDRTINGRSWEGAPHVKRVTTVIFY